MAVPLFFMLSGYFLFNGKATTGLLCFLRRRMSRILIPFISILVFYFIYHYHEWTVREWLYRCLTNQIDYHLWFIYSLVGLYLAIPLFERLFTNSDGLKVVCFYIGLWLLSSSLYEYVKRYIGLTINPFYVFNCEYFFGYIGFFFLGGLFRRIKVTVMWCWFLILIYIIASWCIYRLTKSWSTQLGHPDEMFFENLSPFVVLQAVSFFLAIKDISLKSRLITFLAQHTYWIYLLHILVLGNLQSITGLSIINNTAVNIIIISISTFIIAFLIALPCYRLERILVSRLHLR